MDKEKEVKRGKRRPLFCFFLSGDVKCVNQTGKMWQTKYGYQSESEHSSEQCDMQGSRLGVEK